MGSITSRSFWVFIQESTFSEAYEKATMRPHLYLVVDLYPMTPDSCRLRTNIFSDPHRRIKHLRTFHADFKKQITICNHGTIGLFHLLTLTSKWIRPMLLKKYKYSLNTRLYLESKMGNCAIKQWRLTVQ